MTKIYKIPNLQSKQQFIPAILEFNSKIAGINCLKNNICLALILRNNPKSKEGNQTVND